VTQRQLEVARLSDILKQQSQQNDQSAVKNDEKLKKLKDLLSAANKMIAEKKEQVKTLSDQLDESRSNVGSVADERNKHMHALNEAKGAYLFLLLQSLLTCVGSLRASRAAQGRAHAGDAAVVQPTVCH